MHMSIHRVNMIVLQYKQSKEILKTEHKHSKKRHLVEMFKKYSPLICYATGCDHWVSKYLESYLTAKVIGHLGFHHGISSFKITDLDRERFNKNKVDYKHCFYIYWCIGKCRFAEDL